MEKAVYSKVEAWYLDDSTDPLAFRENPRLPHRHTPNQPVPREHVFELGVITWSLDDVDNWENNDLLEAIKKERGYNYWDIATVGPGLVEDFEGMIHHFFTEHLHPVEESRLVLEGAGYWDIRDYDERWIRFRIQKGDLIVLPEGMYHRFTVDTDNYVKAVRLFKTVPCRTQHERPADDIDARKLYVQRVLNNPHALYRQSKCDLKTDCSAEPPADAHIVDE